ncbi:MAG: DUF2796 domain-containing protein, partial [uncultured Thiotrichaceae bacterium]
MERRLPTKFAITLFLQLAIASSAYSNGHSEHAHEKKTHDKTEDSHDRVQHGSHEHGAARLTVAKTDQGLEIMLESPAANLFGFEHKAHDKEEHETIHQVKEKLEAGETLFTMNDAAKCTLSKAAIESDIVSSHKKEKHDNEHKDDHESHDHEKERTHSDVEVAWVFTCESPAALKSVDTTLFSQFPKGFEQLNVEWISNDGAGTSTLKSDGTI